MIDSSPSSALPMPWALPDFVPLLRHSDAGADFVANAAASWWEWEDPLPTVLAGLRDLFPGAFYDVGANTGFYSVLIARLDANRVVRAFEPLSNIAEACASNLALAGVAERVTIEHVALSDTDGQAEIFLPPAEGDLIETKATLEVGFLSAVAGRTTIDCTTLDHVNQRCDAERIGLIKIDVEGAEARVLHGGQRTIARDRPLISVELLDRSPEGAISDFLRRSSYLAVNLRPGMEIEVAGDAGVADPAGWNQLLVPSEALSSVMGRLQTLAADYHRVTGKTQTPNSGAQARDELLRLPTQMLVDQLAIRARLIEILLSQNRAARYAALTEPEPANAVKRSAPKRRALLRKARVRLGLD